MTLWHAVRVFERAAYDECVPLVARAVSGDAKARDALATRCRRVLDSSMFERYNGPGVRDAFAATLAAMDAHIDDGSYAGTVVSLLAMPLFQHAPLAAGEPSPCFAALGRDDGGLWQPLSAGGLPRFFGENRGPMMRFGPGMGTSLVEGDDLAALHDGLVRFVLVRESDAASQRALAQLRRVSERASASHLALALSDQ